MLRRIIKLLTVLIALAVQLPAHSEDIDLFSEPDPTPTTLPNVLIILIDDFGFGQSAAFGGPITMPTLDRVAAEGVRYTRFHTTALCSPTRTALLTGHNHHANNAGAIAGMAAGFSMCAYYMAHTMPLMGGSAAGQWFSIAPISAGVFGVPAGIAVLVLVSLCTRAPGPMSAALVEHIRSPV